MRNDDLFYNLTVNKKSATIIADAERELLKLSALYPFGLSKRQANRTKKRRKIEFCEIVKMAVMKFLQRFVRLSVPVWNRN